MAPDMEVTSTVASGNSNNSSDSDHSNEIPSVSTVSAVTVNSSVANLHSNAENQFKVRPSNYTFLHSFNLKQIKTNIQYDFSVFVLQHTLVCVPTMVSIQNSIAQQSQTQQSDSSFQLALASSSAKNFSTIRESAKTIIAKPMIQKQQLHQNLNKMPGIVFANTIQLQQSQLQAKLQRQSSQVNTSNTHPLTTQTIQRMHKIQLTQATAPTIVQGDK